MDDVSYRISISISIQSLSLPSLVHGRLVLVVVVVELSDPISKVHKWPQGQ